jgi:hypothetical protein
MTDHELLKAAAKAAGYKGGKRRAGDDSSGLHFGVHTYTPMYWNPLTDDGDAFRLAVKLNLMIDQGINHSRAITDGIVIDELRGADPLAATRRAIVRAAAAMAT